MTSALSINRGRLIIGERPAEDAVQCLRCRRRYEANSAPAGLTSCAFCGAIWDELPEWDRSSIMRRVRLVEMRWRDGFTFGPWHFAELVPGSVTEDEFQDIMRKLIDAEIRRYARFKGALRFEYRSVSLDLEVYQRNLAG
ncbi:MAG TPA: hypothetical protein VGM76_01685 [Lacipirellulaceae bacterium]|jgi:hypothetical protein